MNEWQKTVSKLCKLHKGKSLSEIFPLAKIEYRKTNKVGQTVKKSKTKTRRGKKHRGKKQKGGTGSVVAAQAQAQAPALGGTGEPVAYNTSGLDDINAYQSGGSKKRKKRKKHNRSKK